MEERRAVSEGDALLHNGGDEEGENGKAEIGDEERRGDSAEELLEEPGLLRWRPSAMEEERLLFLAKKLVVGLM